jgi:hypothetical protein
MRQARTISHAKISPFEETGLYTPLERRYPTTSELPYFCAINDTVKNSSRISRITVIKWSVERTRLSLVVCVDSFFDYTKRFFHLVYEKRHNYATKDNLLISFYLVGDRCQRYRRTFFMSVESESDSPYF